MRLTPARRRGVEILDDPGIPAGIRQRAMADVARANVLFGGTRSVLRAFRHVLPHLQRHATVLDVGTGLADIPFKVRDAATGAGILVTPIGLDVAESIVRAARERLSAAIVGSALRLPIVDGGADVVTCSQLLHHFEEHDARRVIAELERVSRGWIVISDLRRSWLAAVGFWVASLLLRFDPITRRDGVTSVFRGFTPKELESLVFLATGARPHVRRDVFWRLSATWRKDSR